MTKIRTLDQLEAALTSDLSWRKQELFVFERQVTRSKPEQQSALLRAGLALLYAHWEGYVKSAGALYLEYISRKGLALGGLRPEIAAIALRSRIQSLAAEKSPESHTALVRMLWDTPGEPANIPYESSTIRTYANLNFKLFASIMHSLGCESAHFATKSVQIDERLLAWRNEIAHGRDQFVSFEDWSATRETVELILSDVRTQIANAAATRTYLRST